jgi:hypothetical protein
MRRPSPALVLSIIAIVIACAGSAGAAALITTKDIKDHTIRGKDVASNTITGRNVKGLSGRDVIKDGLDGSDIDESTLDTVPSATRATTADSVNGARLGKLAFRRGAGTAATTVYDEGGLKVTASCSAGGVLSAVASPSGSAGGVVRLQVTRTGGSSFVADNDFSGTRSVDLVTGGPDNAQGRLTFTEPSGNTITLDYLTQDNADPARGYACLLAGTAVRTMP